MLSRTGRLASTPEADLHFALAITQSQVDDKTKILSFSSYTLLSVPDLCTAINPDLSREELELCALLLCEELQTELPKLKNLSELLIINISTKYRFALIFLLLRFETAPLLPSDVLSIKSK